MISFFNFLNNLSKFFSSLSPLTTITIFYALGVGLFHDTALSLIFYLSITLLFLFFLLAEYTYIKNRYAHFFLLAATATACGSLSDHYQQHNHRTIQKSLAGTHTITGTVIDLATAPKGYLRNIITLRIHEVDKTSMARNHLILFYTRKKDDIEVGDIIEISDIHLKEIDEKAAFKDYVIKQGYAFTCFTPTFTYRLIHRPQYSIKRFFHTQRKNLFEHIKKTHA